VQVTSVETGIVWKNVKSPIFSNFVMIAAINFATEDVITDNSWESSHRHDFKVKLRPTTLEQ